MEGEREGAGLELGRGRREQFNETDSSRVREMLRERDRARARECRGREREAPMLEKGVE